MSHSSGYRVYIHFPFCLKKCDYCDFNSVACGLNQVPHEEYAGALVREVSSPESRVPSLSDSSPFTLHSSHKIETIYFGGGTPSLMRPKDVGRVLETLAQHLSFSPDVEISLEANPGTVNQSKLKDFAAAGINRLSIGVQSFHDQHLREFGRIHTADEARQAIRDGLACGFKEVGLDLIFGFPGQTVEEWRSDLAEAVGFCVKHVSAYALEVPDSVGGGACLPAGRSRPEQIVDNICGKMPLLPESAEMQRGTYTFMEEAGLPAYEISNFAARGNECRHNLGYWRYEDFWGMGAGAVSQGIGDGGLGIVVRRTNFKDPKQYILAVEEGKKYFEEEIIDQKTAQFEFIMMGLRTREGIAADKFQERFGESFEERYKEAIERGVKSGWLRVMGHHGERYAPTVDGFLFNNQLVGLFL